MLFPKAPAKAFFSKELLPNSTFHFIYTIIYIRISFTYIINIIFINITYINFTYTIYKSSSTGVVTQESQQLLYRSCYTGVVPRELFHRSCYTGVVIQELFHGSCYRGANF